MYKISPFKAIKSGNPGLYEFLNHHSKIKIYAPYMERVHYHMLTPEEAIARAVKTENLRVILSSISLFNKVKNWPSLNKIAKKENIGKKVGALYDVARKIIRVRRMDKKTRKSLLKSKIDSKFIVKNAKTKDFEDIEKIWKVYIPFNKEDLDVYNE